MPNLKTQPVDFTKTHTPTHGIPIPENAFGRIVYKDKPTFFCICRIGTCDEIVSFANRSRNSLYNHIEHHSKMETNIVGSNKRPRKSSTK